MTTEIDQHTPVRVIPNQILANVSLWKDRERLENAFADWPFSRAEVRLMELEKDEPLDLENLIDADHVVVLENDLLTLRPIGMPA